MQAPGQEIRLLSAGTIEHLFEDVAAAFELECGHRVTARFNPTGTVVRWVEAGEPCDAVVLATDASLDRLAAGGYVLSASRVTFAKAVIGIAVRDGAPAIDISTAAAVRAAMLAAGAFAHASPEAGSSSGAHVRGVIERLGIADNVRDRIVMRDRGQATIRAVAEGMADFVVAQSTEIAAVSGVRYIGPLPAELQAQNPVGGAVHARSRHPAEAAALLAFLASPTLRPHWRKLGFADP
jgi:molybdate transport system substrate-binding protein